MTKFSKNTFAFCLLSITSLFCLPTLAAANNQLNPYIPHAYLNGYLGDGGAGNFVGRADILAPLYTTNNSDLFVYAQGFMGDKTYDSASNVWQLSAGTGYRQIIGSRIYGAYLFGDYTGTEENNEFWMLSPGIESLGEFIDFRANGYFPIGTDKWTKDSVPVFVSHETNYDLYQYYTDTESVGPGADIEIGAKLFSINHMPFKLFLDGYAFYPEDIDHILGIGGRATFQLTRYLTLEGRYTYDNENHNVFMGGIRLYLNGFAYGLENNHVDDIGIQPRLYDQIERNFAAGSVGSAATTSNKEVPNGGPQPSDYYTVYVINDESGNISTTDSTEPAGDGTLENPYIYNSSDDMQSILDKTYSTYGTDKVVRVYYTSPNNTPFYMPSYTDDSSYVYPYTNQQLWGTTGNDWKIPTTPDTYAVDFLGGFYLDGVSDVQFHYLWLGNHYDTTPFPTAMQIDNSQNIVLQSVQIGSSSAGVFGYETGIAINNYSSVTLNDAKVYGNGNNGIGMTIIDGGDITLIKNTLVQGEKAGISLLNDIAGKNITGNFIGDTTAEVIGGTYGLYASGSSTTTSNIGDISGISFIATSSNSYGFYVSNGREITIGNISDSHFQGGTGFSAIAGGTYQLQIGNILNSEFIGSVKSAMYLSGKAIMGNIIDSNFNGYSTGLYMTGGNPSVTIGNIENSVFKGNISYGFVIDIGNANIQIGNINDSSFISSLTGIYFNRYSSLNIGGTAYTNNAEDLYNYLIDKNNTFTTPANKRVCLFKLGTSSAVCF